MHLKYIDTHCHLYDEAFDPDREEVIERAVASGVTTMLLPDIDSTSTARLQALQSKHPTLFRSMTGLHPTSVKEDYEDELAHVSKLLEKQANNHPYVAIGEIGMDLYWDKTNLEQQRDAMKRQMEWAEKYNLPVCLHIRKAHNEVFGLLRDMNRHSYRGVMHCFGGSLQEAYRAVEMGFYLGIGGVVTYKNATMAEIAKNIPLDRLVLETDAPYLPPHPYRGKRNESSYLPIIAQQIACLRDISIEEVANQTAENATKLFNLNE